ncbi:Hypothetical predicted protein [Marmota monax]|uniref:Uncharacterized protein n=1 Tax=Marmota monax TaxID=9995 RepID=A0A5E4C3T9_MARMO|nr:hypothetical protein GHT09_015270 [Marmota monax]VTJ76544.1 Hypothetical predicted protein [Marmota monax]
MVGGSTLPASLQGLPPWLSLDAGSARDVVRGGEEKMASQLGERMAGGAGRGADWCLPSADHSQSSKSSCWGNGEEKRGLARSKLDPGSSAKSLIPKESWLDAFWD